MRDVLMYSMAFVLAAGGLAAVIYALLADRSRGRRRCPKCWYDMSASPGLVCSECGYEATHVKKFYKTRRRWKVAAIATLVGVAGLAAPKAQEILQDGWDAVPTLVLLVFYGYPSLPWYEDVYTVLDNRVRQGDLWGFEWAILHRINTNDPQFRGNFAIALPQRWLVGDPIEYRVLYTRKGRLEMRVGGRRVWSGIIEAVATVYNEPTDALGTIEDVEYVERFARAIRMQLPRRSRPPRDWIRVSGETVIGGRIEIYRDDQRVWEVDALWNGRLHLIHTRIWDSESLSLDPSQATWRAKFTADPTLIFDRAPNATQSWEGTLDIPLQWDEQHGRLISNR